MELVIDDGETHDGRRSYRTTFPDGQVVSTVDLWGDDGLDALDEMLGISHTKPFETMTFDPPRSGYVDLACDRDLTWEEAMKSHEKQVNAMKESLAE